MEPNKFEEHIKKQLEERGIKPSSDAWSKLNDRLDEIEPKRPIKRRYLWYAAAACLGGLLILSGILLRPSAVTILESNVQVVEDDNKVGEETNGFEKIAIQEDKVEIVSDQQFVEKNATDSVIVADVLITNREEVVTQITDNSTELGSLMDNTSEVIINTKILQIVAEVDALEQDEAQLTDAEVDSLLRKAQEEILADKLFRSNRSVDAMALLSEVENELDKSFRDQIFDSLKSGFLKVRTAVADRNN